MSNSEKTTKPQTFRIDAELAEQFRIFCDENKLSQSDGFKQLLVSLELNRASMALPSRETEINNFQSLISAIQSAFLNSLEICENAELRIGENFKREIETQSKVISDYQDKIKFLEDELEKANQKALNYDVLARETAALKTSLSEREELVKSLQRQVSKLDDFENLQQELFNLKTELLKKEKEMRELCEKHTAEILKIKVG